MICPTARAKYFHAKALTNIWGDLPVGLFAGWVERIYVRLVVTKPHAAMAAISSEISTL